MGTHKIEASATPAQDNKIYRVCINCKKSLELNSENYRFEGNKSWWRTDCRKCESKKQMKRGEINREEYDTLRKGHCCEKCGLDLFWCLEHHHIDPTKKKFTISDGFMKKRYRLNSKIMQDELKKCIVLCKNCHCTLHSNINALLLGLPPRAYQQIYKESPTIH
jgi:hypothetical protein